MNDSIKREQSELARSVERENDCMKGKKILFLHGFFASGQCVPAVALRDARQSVFQDDGVSA